MATRAVKLGWNAGYLPNVTCLNDHNIPGSQSGLLVLTQPGLGDEVLVVVPNTAILDVERLEVGHARVLQNVPSWAYKSIGDHRAKARYSSGGPRFRDVS